MERVKKGPQFQLEKKHKRQRGPKKHHYRRQRNRSYGFGIIDVE